MRGRLGMGASPDVEVSSLAPGVGGRDSQVQCRERLCCLMDLWF